MQLRRPWKPGTGLRDVGRVRASSSEAGGEKGSKCGLSRDGLGNGRRPEVAHSEALDIQMAQPISRPSSGEGAGEAETGHSDNSPFSSFQPSVCSLWKIRTIQNKEENKNGLPLSCHSKKITVSV